MKIEGDPPQQQIGLSHYTHRPHRVYKNEIKVYSSVCKKMEWPIL